MYKIILYLIFFSAINLWAKESAEVLRIGVTQTKSVTHPEIKFRIENSIFNFKFDESELVLLNQLISGQLDIAILSTENALKALWYGEGCHIIGLIGPNTNYLITRKQNQKINKYWFKDKSILLINNSAEEYYLKEFLHNLKFKKIPINSKQKANAIRNDLYINGTFADSVFISKIDSLNRSKFDITPVAFGDYLVVSRHSFQYLLEYGRYRKAFTRQNLKIKNLKKNDVYKLKKINDFIFKKTLDNLLDSSFNQMLNQSE